MVTTKGQLIVFTSGSYDDYKIEIACRATRGFSMEEQRQRHQSERSSQHAGLRFFDWLIAQKLIEKIEYQEENIEDQQWTHPGREFHRTPEQRQAMRAKYRDTGEI